MAGKYWQSKKRKSLVGESDEIRAKSRKTENSAITDMGKKKISRKFFLNFPIFSNFP